MVVRSNVSTAAAVLWIDGPDAAEELALARAWIAAQVDVLDAPSVAAAIATPPAAFADRSPAAILVAAAAPASPRLADCIAISRRWPLAPVVSVAATLVEGRRRSGPHLQGIEEIAWNELPGRMACWLRDRGDGVPGTLGMPATARRDERMLEAARRIAEAPPPRSGRIVVAAPHPLDAEGLADLVAATGHEVVARHVGRPPIDHQADAVVWDTGLLGDAQITWLGMTVANRPDAPVVLLDAFPRADTARLAVHAGAAAVLGRPVSLESLSGVLHAAAARL